MIDPLNAVLIPQLLNDATLHSLSFLKAYVSMVPQGTGYNYIRLWQTPNDSSYGDEPLETMGGVAMITSRFLVDFVTNAPNDDATTAADARVKALWFKTKPTLSGYRVLGATYEQTKWSVRTLRASGTQIRVASTPWVWRVAPL